MVSDYLAEVDSPKEAQQPKVKEEKDKEKEKEKEKEKREGGSKDDDRKLPKIYSEGDKREVNLRGDRLKEFKSLPGRA